MIYGHNGTLHGAEKLDIVVDKKGNVKEVWFRCLSLPFRVGRRDKPGTTIATGGPEEIRIVSIEVEQDGKARYQVFKDVRGVFPGYGWLIGDVTAEECLHIVGFFGREEMAREVARQLNEYGSVEYEPESGA